VTLLLYQYIIAHQYIGRL